MTMKFYTFLILLTLGITSCKTTQIIVEPKASLHQQYLLTYNKFYQKPDSIEFEDLFYDYLDSDFFLKNAEIFNEFELIEGEFYSGVINCSDISFVDLLRKMPLSARAHSLAVDCAEQSDDQDIIDKHNNMLEYLIKGYFSEADGLSHFSAIKVADWGEPVDILNLLGYKKIDAYAQPYARGSLYSYVVIAEDEEDGIQKEFYFNTWDALEKRYARGEDAFDIYDFDYSLGTLFDSLGDNDPAFKYGYARYAWSIEPEAAPKALIEAAKGSNVKSQELLAAEILKGTQIAHYNKDDAIDLLVSAAEQEYAIAYIYLSYLYRVGNLLEKDISAADKLLSKAIKKLGKGKAYHALAKAYYSFDKGNPKRLEWLNRAAAEGNAEANMELYLYYAKDDEEKSQQHLNTAVNQGAHLGAYIKAVKYIQLDEKNIKDKAAELEQLLLQAAPRIPKAHRMLSFYYSLPEHKNITKSVHHLLKAATFGDDESQVALARLLQQGAKGIMRNPREANRWFNQAVKQQNSNAMLDLGYNYEKGIGIKRNFEKAKFLYQVAAELGNTQGMFNLGYMLLKGEIAEQDIDSGIEWIEKAAAKYHPGALNELALEYQSGENLEKDLTKAIAYFHKAADNGSKYAMYNLGMAYKDGNGVEADKVKAKSWFQKAFDAGHTNAIFELKEL